MQTFLPLESFTESAKCLDYRRLGKQRVEVLQILNAITVLSSDWTNHPATIIWKNNVYQLKMYGVAICEEWISRGYKDSCKEKILSIISNDENKEMPIWIGNELLHRSHRSQLLRKDQNFYSQFNWKELPDEFPYWWPSKELDL